MAEFSRCMCNVKEHCVSPGDKPQARLWLSGRLQGNGSERYNTAVILQPLGPSQDPILPAVVYIISTQTPLYFFTLESRL